MSLSSLRTSHHEQRHREAGRDEAVDAADQRIDAERRTEQVAAEEADRMFEAAGFESIEHVTMGPDYDPDIAITTVARVPA